MAYPTNAQIEAAVPATGEPVRSLTQSVLKGLVGSLPRGTTRQVARFNLTSGELEAGVFTANMWSEFAGGAPTTGVWLACFIPQSPEVMGFAEATNDPTPNTVPVRSAEGTGTGGRLKAAPATDPDDCVTKAQLDALPVGGGVTPTPAPVITIGDPVDDENVQASFDALIAALKTAGVLT